jgi:hypothetical protein
LLLKYQPLQNKYENNIAFFIEFFASFYLYVLLPFTNWPEENLPMKEKLSWVLTILIISIIAINVFLLLVDKIQYIK